MACQALARHAVGVAHSDRAAVHIQTVGRDAQLIAAVQHLHRKGFVQLPQVNVLHCEAKTRQRFGHCVHRTNAHFVGLATSHSKTEETAQRLQASLLGQLFVHEHASACTVRELAGIACRHQTTGQRRTQATDGFHGGAFAQAFVHAQSHLLGGHAHDLVDHALRDGDGGDFVVEQTGGLRGAGLLLAGRAIRVHHIAADLVALGHLLGGLQHVPVNLGLHLGQCQVLQHVGVGLLLHARDAFHATGHIHLAFARDDALRSQSNGLQARRAKAVDGHARHGNGQTGLEGDLAGDVGTGGAFGGGAAHDHVFDFGGVNACAGHGVLHRVATQGGPVGHVESALPAFGQRGAGGGNDYGVGHDENL